MPTIGFRSFKSSPKELTRDELIQTAKVKLKLYPKIEKEFTNDNLVEIIMDEHPIVRKELASSTSWHEYYCKKALTDIKQKGNYLSTMFISQDDICPDNQINILVNHSETSTKLSPDSVLAPILVSIMLIFILYKVLK